MDINDPLLYIIDLSFDTHLAIIIIIIIIIFLSSPYLSLWYVRLMQFCHFPSLLPGLKDNQARFTIMTTIIMIRIAPSKPKAKESVVKIYVITSSVEILCKFAIQILNWQFSGLYTCHYIKYEIQVGIDRHTFIMIASMEL